MARPLLRQNAGSIAARTQSNVLSKPPSQLACAVVRRADCNTPTTCNQIVHLPSNDTAAAPYPLLPICAFSQPALMPGGICQVPACSRSSTNDAIDLVQQACESQARCCDRAATHCRTAMQPRSPTGRRLTPTTRNITKTTQTARVKTRRRKQHQQQNGVLSSWCFNRARTGLYLSGRAAYRCYALSNAEPLHSRCRSSLITPPPLTSPARTKRGGPLTTTRQPKPAQTSTQPESCNTLQCVLACSPHRHAAWACMPAVAAIGHENDGKSIQPCGPHPAGIPPDVPAWAADG